MTRRDLAIKIAEEMGLKQGIVLEIVEKTFEYMIEELVETGVIEFRNFGVFEVVTRKAKKGRNPNKPKDEVIIPEHSVIKFKTGKVLKEKLAEIDSKKLKHN